MIVGPRPDSARARNAGAWLLAIVAAAGLTAPGCSRDPKPGGAQGGAAGGAAGGGAPAGSAPAAGFVERGVEAGIDFHMKFLPLEQGENFKINLYDHGCGVAVVDYDGDGDEDVYLVNQLGPNGLYRNDGTGKFTNVTDEAGVGVGDRICVAPLFADVDADGDQDLYVTSTRGGNLLLVNDGRGKFTDGTAAAGLTLVAHSQSACFFDADADGDLDLFVSNTAKWTYDQRDPDDRYFRGAATLADLVASPHERNVFYVNDGKGKFTDATARAGLGGSGWGGDAISFDADGDGRQDLFVTNMFGANSLFRNRGDGTFEDVTRASLGSTSWGAIGAKPFDFDGDGRLDLMVMDMHSDMWLPFDFQLSRVDVTRKYSGPEGPMVEIGALPASDRDRQHALLRLPKDGVVYGNTLFRNLGGGKFEEVSDRAGAETFWPWSICSADFDMDGWVDAFLASGMGFPYPYWHSPLLMNRGDGTFEDRSKQAGLDPPPGGAYLTKSFGGKRATKSARCTASGDFDGDGRPDFVMNNFNERAYLYMNRYPERSWLGFRLRGTQSNRDAIGALVTLRVGGRTQVRQVESAGGYLSQSSRALRFGLGDAKSVESCEILWPSGVRQTVPVAKLNAVIDVVEPAR